ncbi:MAG: alpha/beta fold hydrolase [Halioglobus sp.]
MQNSPPSPPNLSTEVPEDSAQTPKWFESALSTPRAEGWVESDGCSIHYFSWGDPSNPGVLLLHGFLAHARCFAFIAPLLADDYYVVAYDFSGMGDSGFREEYPDGVRQQELIDVAQATGLFAHERKPMIVAHSYGGSVGLSTVEEHHERFSGLVICDLMTLRPERLASHMRPDESAGDKSDNNERKSRPNKVYADYETAKGRFVLSPPQAVNEPYLFDYMAYHSLKEVEGGWSWKFHPSVFMPLHDLPAHMLRQTQRIANAPGKVIVVYGQHSELFDADSAQYLRECGGEHLPMIEIPEARHHLMLDQPLAFVSTLRTILLLAS